jgi:hypothetical protein
MGSLSNLYISQSYISLLHLGSNNTASSTPTEIQDGLGNGIGITVNTAGDLFVGNRLTVGKAVTFSGSVQINTEFTSSTPTYVNSGNYFTDSIIRITGSFASGSSSSPTVNEVQIGWPVYGNGLVSGAVVTNKQYVNANFVELTINQNTAQWFGNYYFTNPTPQYFNFSVSGSEDITGSLWVRDDLSVNDISASGNISASNLWVKDKIHAYELDVTIVSSSIVFTSGSNIIGDNANQDVQLIIGRTIVTGSLEITGSTKINGNTTITGSLTASGNISSSTISGIGNVTLFSQSVDNRLDLLENFSSSQYKADSASFQSQITTNSASFAAYSSSLVSTFATNAFVLANTASLSSSIYFTDSSQSARLTAIEANYATTGSNRFVGNQTITGSLILSSSAAIELSVNGNSTFSGSVNGVSIPLSIVSSTASIDCSLGNFFTLTLVGSATTFLQPTNIRPGQTLSLKVTQPVGDFGSVTYPTSIKFPISFPYQATPSGSAEDILSFQSYDTSSLYGVAVNRLV